VVELATGEVEMSDSFNAAINHLLLMEGGYSNDPDDNGGETNFGISKRAFPMVDIASITRTDAVEIYRKNYWNAIRGDDIPPLVGFIMLDIAVNHGVITATKMLQRQLNVAADGVIGAKTMTALSRENPAMLAQRLTLARIKMVIMHEDAARYMTGWLSRYLTVMREVCVQWGELTAVKNG